jgi:hypothetical protein
MAEAETAALESAAPEAQEPGASAKPKGKEKGAGRKAGKKGKAKRDAGAPVAAGSGADMRLAAHPQAARRVAEAKAWGAVIGFALGGYLSLPTHTLADAAARALLAGLFCRTVVWAAAIFVWRRIVVAELRHAQHELLAAKLSERAAAER